MTDTQQPTETAAQKPRLSLMTAWMAGFLGRDDAQRLSGESRRALLARAREADDFAETAAAVADPLAARIRELEDDLRDVRHRLHCITLDKGFGALDVLNREQALSLITRTAAPDSGDGA